MSVLSLSLFMALSWLFLFLATLLFFSCLFAIICNFEAYIHLLQDTRFLFEGERVKGSDTAASLGLAEGDTIEVNLVSIHSSYLSFAMFLVSFSALEMLRILDIRTL